MSGKGIPVRKDLAATDNPRRQRKRGCVEDDEAEAPPPQPLHQLSDDIQLRLGRIAILAEINRDVDVAEVVLLLPHRAPEKTGELHPSILFKNNGQVLHYSVLRGCDQSASFHLSIRRIAAEKCSRPVSRSRRIFPPRCCGSK